MLTKTKFISDVILQLNQGQVSDDLELEDSQVAQWGTYHLNNLVKQEIEREKSLGNMIPPIYIVRETGRPLSEETVADIDDLNQRMWITLTQEVLDLPKDAGIVAVWDYDLNLIHKASIDRLYMLNTMRFAKPTPENKLYYRSGNKIFIEGWRTDDMEFNEVIVDYVPKQDILSLGDSDEILITDQLVPMLVALTVQTGKMQMYGSSPDQNNDGQDVKSTSYHTAIANPTKQVEE